MLILLLLYHKTNLENYSPITVFSHLYKLRNRIIMPKPENKLELYQPIEKAKFSFGFETNDHLWTI